MSSPNTTCTLSVPPAGRSGKVPGSDVRYQGRHFTILSEPHQEFDLSPSIVIAAIKDTANLTLLAATAIAAAVAATTVAATTVAASAAASEAAAALAASATGAAKYLQQMPYLLVGWLEISSTHSCVLGVLAGGYWLGAHAAALDRLHGWPVPHSLILRKPHLRRSTRLRRIQAGRPQLSLHLDRQMSC